MNNLQLLPIFNTAEERQKYIKNNANYFTITWRQDRRNIRLEYRTLNAARTAAKIVSRYHNKDIMIYAVITPFSDESEPYGYSSWIETIRWVQSVDSQP